MRRGGRLDIARTVSESARARRRWCGGSENACGDPCLLLRLYLYEQYRQNSTVSAAAYLKTLAISLLTETEPDRQLYSGAGQAIDMPAAVRR